MYTSYLLMAIVFNLIFYLEMKIHNFVANDKQLSLMDDI